MKTIFLVFSSLFGLGGFAAAADAVDAWSPPDLKKGSATLVGAGEMAHGYYASTAAFGKVWTHYALKLGSKESYKPGHRGHNRLKEVVLIHNYDASQSRERASVLIRREPTRDISVTLVDRGEGGVQVFVSILPRRL